jgi:hypothetical protein
VRADSSGRARPLCTPSVHAAHRRHTQAGCKQRRPRMQHASCRWRGKEVHRAPWRGPPPHPVCQRHSLRVAELVRQPVAQHLRAAGKASFTQAFTPAPIPGMAMGCMTITHASNTPGVLALQDLLHASLGSRSPLPPSPPTCGSWSSRQTGICARHPSRGQRCLHVLHRLRLHTTASWFM